MRLPFNPPIWDERTVAFERKNWETIQQGSLINGQTTTKTLLAIMLATALAAGAIANILRMEI